MTRLITAICLVLVLAASALAQCNTSCFLSAPGLRYPLVDWRFVNSGNLPQTHAVFMTEDTVTVKVESGSRLNLTPNEIEIVLTSNGTWRKELVAWNKCTGGTGMIATQGSNKGPVSMRLNRTNCLADTIILRKEKFILGMVNMYHMDPHRFWALWAGKIITINWFSDWESKSFPPVCNFPCVPTQTSPTAGMLYDTDSKTDIALFRQTTDQWFVVNSSTGVSFERQLGNLSSTPVPYDYDGDGRTDMGVWDRQTGEWKIIHSLTGQTRAVQWGLNGDIPMPGDYDGDGKADLAVWRPSSGTWFIKGYITGAESTRQLGSPTDMPVAADYDGDRKTDPAVWTPSNGYWNVLTNPPRAVQWGLTGDIPVPADYDGDGKTDYAVWRNQVWWILNSSTGERSEIPWNVGGGQPVPGDYDGDGKTDLAVYRAWTSEWLVKKSSDGSTVLLAVFGGQLDVTVPRK